MCNNELNMTAIIQCVLNLGLSNLNVLVKPAEILLDELANALAIGKRLLLTKLLRGFQLGLNEIQRFRGCKIVDRIDAIVVEIIDDCLC